MKEAFQFEAVLAVVLGLMPEGVEDAKYARTLLVLQTIVTCEHHLREYVTAKDMMGW